MVKRPHSPSTTGGESNGDEDNGNEGGGRGMRIDPLIKALLGHLPPSKSVWPPNERQKWLALFGEALSVIYKDAEQAKPPSGAGPVHGASNPPRNLPTS